MPIDPRIALGVQAPQIESPMNVMANALKLRAMQNENALFEQQQRQAAMQAEEQNRLRSLLAGGASAEQLMRSGFFEQGAKLGEFGRQQSAEGRAQAEEARKAAEREQQVRELGYGFLSEAVDANSWRIVRRLAEKSGLPMDGVPGEDEYDPKWVEATRRVLGPELEFRDVGGGVAGLRKRTGETVSITQDIPKPEAVVRQDERVAAAGAGRSLTVQEKAEQGEYGKLLIKNYETIAGRAESGRRFLPTLEQAQRALNEGVRTGFGAETMRQGARVLAALGEPDAAAKAANADLFLAAAKDNVLRRQLEQKGPQTDQDAQRIEETFIGLGKTPAANQFVLDVARAQIKRDMEQQKFYTDWRRRNGTFDGAEEAWIEGEGSRSLFDRAELKKYGAAGAEAPAPPPGFKLDAPARR